MNSITHDDILNLKADQLTNLLLMLLHLEYKKYNFPNCYINVPQNITTADGGEDGRITTDDNKDSRWIINKFCLFQSKATDLSISDCSKEILEKKKKTKDKDVLKSQVKVVFDNDGTYILFVRQAFVELVRNEELNQRIKSIRDSIEKAEGKTYADSAKIKIYDANLIRDWTNEYITAVSYVQICNGINRPLGLLVWNELKSYSNNQSLFKSNPELDDIIEQIRNRIENSKNLRIEGVSGIGKTRLVCEALSPGEKDENGDYDIIRKSISDSVIYFDLGTDNGQVVLDYVRSLGTTFPAILVLDNCEPFYHQQFINETQRNGGLIKILSIDYEKWSNSDFVDCDVIELKSVYYNSVVQDILKEEYSNKLSDSDISSLVNFSEGNPKMAINFVQAALRELNLGQSFNDELVKKLIFGRSSYSEEDFKVLIFFSAFKYFEYPADEYINFNPSHYKTLLEHLEYFEKRLNISKQSLRELIIKYLDKGVLERRGHKIIIRPNPLSLKLSLIFWKSLDPSDYENFLNELPQSLRKPLVEQLQQLGNVDYAKNFVERAWGVDGNFSKAEILNSNMGSHLFRSIVTVNPEATIKVLTKNYLDKPKDYLVTIVEGRQNIVWALERLCFRKETFIEAAKVLMCFSVAEIETYYSNNATDYFTQLFRIFLAGTETNFEPRIEVLKWALEKNDPDFDEIIVKACERAFTPIHSIHKMGGAENQGGLLPLEEYKPHTVEEINEYRTEIIEILLNFVSKENNHQLAAQRAIYSNIIDLFEYNFNIEKLDKYIKVICENIIDKDDFIKSMYSQVSSINLNINQRNFLTGYIELLKTNSIEERILYNVSEPRIIIKSIKDEDDYEVKGKKLAEQFAVDVINEKIDIRPYFKNLILGNQFYTFDFGKKLSELSDYNQEFIDDLILELIKLEKEQCNISFLFGYISVLSEEKRNEIFNTFIKNKSSFAFNILRFVEVNFENVLKLINLIKESGISSNKLSIIKYEIANLNSIDKIKYFELIKPFENGHVIILDTFSTLIWLSKNNDLKLEEDILGYIKKLIEEENIFIKINSSRNLDFYSLHQIIKLLLDKFDKELTSTISNQIVEFQESLSLFSSSDKYLSNISNMTLDIDFENCWNIYSKLLFEKKMFQFWNIFDMNFISGVSFNHPFFNNEKRNNHLLAWLLKNKEFAPWIIRVAPLFDEDGVNWFYFTESLINAFGDNEHFINELSANLHSMTTWGSRVPYLKSRLKLVEQLKNHKIEKVRIWANEEIENYLKSIKIEEINDEEEYLGY